MSARECESEDALEGERVSDNKGVGEFSEPLINAIKYGRIKPNG